MRVTFSPADEDGRWTVATIEALPTFIDLNPDIRVVDLERTLANSSVPAGRRRIYEAAVERIESAVLSRGGGSLIHVRATGR
jgi:poly-gamma-glutamate synthesis protein (capsule biosynthesis protein)